LLHARLTLVEQREGLPDPERLADALNREDVGIALQTVLAALKSRYVGINMLEISTSVYLGKTSLYAHGSSQYEQVRLT